MFPTARPVIGLGVLAIGCFLGIEASSAQAQALASPQALGSVSPAPVYSYPAPRYYIPAPVYSYPAQCYYIPAPVSSYPARTWAYQPRRSDSYSAPPFPLRPKTTSSPTATIPITIKTASSTTPAIRTGVLIPGAPGLRVGDESPG